MKRNNSLNELLIEELADLLNGECQLVEFLPKMAEASASSSLKIALEDHLEVTREHILRLQDIFNNIGQNPQGVTCHDMKDFIEEGKKVINDAQTGAARDTAIIGVAQRVEQYEIAGYQRAREHAADLGHTRIVEVLSKTLDEERSMNFHLNELVQYMINVQSINPFDPRLQPNQQQESSSKPKIGGFYVSQKKFGRKGIKRKPKNTDISRFISEGNPNIQEDDNKGKEKVREGTQKREDLS